MLQTVRCIKFGEILLDENRKTLLLCANCHTDYTNLQDFRTHLDHCGGHSIFGDDVSLVFPHNINEAAAHQQHLLGHYAKGTKEYLVYKYNGIYQKQAPVDQCQKNTKADDDFMDLIRIEEELLDPRWYTETSTHDEVALQHKAPSYNELVEAVTPFVQFKENLKANVAGNTKVKRISPAKKQLLAIVKNDKSNSFNGKTSTIESLRLNEKPKASNLKTCTQSKRRLSFHRERTGPTVLINGQSKKSEMRLPVEVVTMIIPTLETAPYCLQKLPTQKQQGAKFLSANSKIAAFTSPSTTFAPNIQINSQLPNKTEPVSAIQNQSNVLQSSLKSVVGLGDKRCNYTSNGLLHSPSHNLSGAVPSAHKLKATKCHAPEAKAMQTEQILNKLQTLGLQVKRKQPIGPTALSSDPAKEHTLQLLKKLQSKGMNVKIIQAPSKNISKLNINSVDVSKRPKMEQGAVNANHAQLTTTTQLNRNLIIKKLN